MPAGQRIIGPTKRDHRGAVRQQKGCNTILQRRRFGKRALRAHNPQRREPRRLRHPHHVDARLLGQKKPHAAVAAALLLKIGVRHIGKGYGIAAEVWRHDLFDWKIDQLAKNKIVCVAERTLLEGPIAECGDVFIYARHSNASFSFINTILTQQTTFVNHFLQRNTPACKRCQNEKTNDVNQEHDRNRTIGNTKKRFSIR